jgi:hypothetical protein
MRGKWVVIPNGCEGSKISPCGRNDRGADAVDIFGIATQSPRGEGSNYFKTGKRKIF